MFTLFKLSNIAKISEDWSEDFVPCLMSIEYTEAESGFYKQDRMEDSEPGWRVELDQEQKKENVQLKVAAWALCKESNVASGMNVGSLPSAVGPEKRLQSEAFEIRHVQETPDSPCKEHVASGKELHNVPSLCKKELKSEELETEKKVYNIVLASGSAGLKRNPIVWCDRGK